MQLNRLELCSIGTMRTTNFMRCVFTREKLVWHGVASRDNFRLWTLARTVSTVQSRVFVKGESIEQEEIES